MGIKGLKAFLRSKFPETLQQTHLSHYFGQRVAVDVLPYLFKFKAVFAEQWHSSMFNFMLQFVQHTVHAHYILDGPCVTVEKHEEQAKRKSARAKLDDKIKAIQADLESYASTQVISDTLRALPIQVSSARNFLMGDDGGDLNTEAVQQHLDKLERQKVSITPADIADIQQMCLALHTPFFTAKQEAESLCAHLCLRGLVDAVVTEDSDVLAYGVPCWLSNVQPDGTCIAIETPRVLAATELTADAWLDFCIMCGTDYNHSVEKLGPVSAYRAIRAHGSMERVAAALGIEGSEWRAEVVRGLFRNPCDTAVRSKHDATEVPCTPSYTDRPNRQSVLALVRDRQWSTNAYSVLQYDENKIIFQ